MSKIPPLFTAPHEHAMLLNALVSLPETGPAVQSWVSDTRKEINAEIALMELPKEKLYPSKSYFYWPWGDPSTPIGAGRERERYDAWSAEVDKEQLLVRLAETSQMLFRYQRAHGGKPFDPSTAVQDWKDQLEVARQAPDLATRTRAVSTVLQEARAFAEVARTRPPTDDLQSWADLELPAKLRELLSTEQTIREHSDDLIDFLYRDAWIAAVECAVGVYDESEATVDPELLGVLAESFQALRDNDFLGRYEYGSSRMSPAEQRLVDALEARFAGEPYAHYRVPAFVHQVERAIRAAVAVVAAE